MVQTPMYSIFSYLKKWSHVNLIHGYGYNLCNAITFATGSLKRGSYESYVTNVQKNGTYTTHLKYLESIYILRK